MYSFCWHIESSGHPWYLLRNARTTCAHHGMSTQVSLWRKPNIRSYTMTGCTIKHTIRCNVKMIGPAVDDTSINLNVSCKHHIEYDGRAVKTSLYLIATLLRVKSTSSATRWFEKQEMLVSTDLDRAGVLRVVQQPHGAIAFPVQTPDAAAH